MGLLGEYEIHTIETITIPRIRPLYLLNLERPENSALSDKYFSYRRQQTLIILDCFTAMCSFQSFSIISGKKNYDQHFKTIFVLYIISFMDQQQKPFFLETKYSSIRLYTEVNTYNEYKMKILSVTKPNSPLTNVHF